MGCTTKYMLDKLGLNNYRRPSEVIMNNNECRSDTFSINNHTVKKKQHLSPPSSDDKYHSFKANKMRQSSDFEDQDNHLRDIEMQDMESPISSHRNYFHHQFTSKMNRMFRKQYYGIHKYWHEFDTKYMQQIFGGSTNPYIQHRNIGIYSNRKQVLSTINNRNDTNTRSFELYNTDNINTR